jgi:hypothetical protein
MGHCQLGSLGFAEAYLEAGWGSRAVERCRRGRDEILARLPRALPILCVQELQDKG